ncbi:MAG TPA: hypothetical protein VLW06_16955 [Terriglobales bacterium]|nr:hypothetical protein [Terriglobales bacterium]
MNSKANLPGPEDVSPKRLWFGFSGAALAWILAGFLDATLAWFACIGGEGGSPVFSTTGMRILLGFISFGLLAMATAGGLISFSNWRKLSRSESFIEAEGRGRKQFMALLGVVISITLGVGIIWFSIPVYLLGICVRGR